MKKAVLIILGLIVVGGGAGGYFWYQDNYGGDSYYTKITTTPEQHMEKDDSGKDFPFYTYEDQPAYDEKGTEKDIELHEGRDKPLRLDAYLKLLVNDKKGVISWEEVSEKDVPKAALAKMN